MDDRFKFKVWDKMTKKMLLSGFRISCDGYLWSGIHITNNYIIIQCTGKKDKNGQLIFERDILNGGSDADIVVSWNEVFGLFECKDIHDGEEYGLFGNTDFKNYEIIGNVHQNPELLEV